MQYSTEAFCLSQSANQVTRWISFTGADQSLGVMRALVCEWIDQSHTVRVCLKKKLIGIFRPGDIKPESNFCLYNVMLFWHCAVFTLETLASAAITPPITLLR